MALKAHQITEAPPVAVKVSIQGSLTTALFWKKQRLDQDSEMYTRWITGDINYAKLADYFKQRLTQSVSGELKAIEALELSAGEKKQQIEDEFAWNQYIQGHKSFRDFNSYLTRRFKEEAEDTPGFIALASLETSAIEKERLAEETAWLNAFDLGSKSYQDTKNFLDERAALYPTNSSRRVNLDSQLLIIEPQFRISELERKRNDGFWGNPKSDGSFDFFQNEQGYLEALRAEGTNYAAGSPQRFEFERAVSEQDFKLRDFQLNQVTSQAAQALRQSVTELTQAENNLTRLSLNPNATPEQLQEAQAAFDTSSQNVESLQSFIQEQQANPQRVTQVPTPRQTSQQQTSQQQTQQLPQQFQPPPTQAVQQVQPAQQASTPAPVELGARIPAPELLALLTEDQIITQGIDKFLKPGVTAPFRKILNLAERDQLLKEGKTSEDFIKTSGGTIFLKL